MQEKIIVGNSALAKEKVMSILKHCTGQHEFSEFSLFKKCLHAVLQDPRPWIKKGMLNILVIQSVIANFSPASFQPSLS